MSIHSVYTKKVLPNGLTVLLVPIENAASFTMSIFVKVGSRYEDASISGLSHFLEHLHFKGCNKYPTAKKLSEVVDSIGGEFNANTGKEHTQYYIRSAFEHMPLVFEVLTDMVQNPIIDEKEMQREKGVIIEEINMYKDNPQINVESLFEETMWPNTPLGADIAGSAEVIKRITREEVMNYRNKFYQPSNMIIAIGGKFDEMKVEQYIQNYWEHLPNNPIGKFELMRDKQSSPRFCLQKKVTEQAHMVLGFRAFPYKHKNNYPLRLLSIILGGGMSSRLFLRVRERLGLAYYVSTSFNNYLDTGNFLVQAGLKVGSCEKAMAVILDEFRKIRDEGIRQGELKKAKEYIKGKVALAMEDPHDKLEWYLGQEAFMGKIKTIKQHFEDLDKVTLAEVNRVAQEVIKNDCLNMALIGPFESGDKFESKLRL